MWQSKQLGSLGHVVHGFFDRHGGVSAAPYDSLNVGTAVGDDAHAVSENRARVARAMGRDAKRLVFAEQVHGVDNIEVTNVCQAAPKVDILWTQQHDVTLALYTADCVPILLATPYAIAAAHAGWKGTALGVAIEAASLLTRTSQVSPDGIAAVLGPAIGPCCYEVDAKTAATLRGAAPDVSPVRTSKTHAYVDLWAINEAILRRAGVNNIEVHRVCTHCTLDYFSHRRDKGRTGRQASVIGLR